MHAGFRRCTMVIAIAWASLIGACGGDSSPQPTPLPQAPPPPPPAPVFDLVPARGRGNLAGFYTLTMQANCKPGQLAVPESIRTRTYDATLGQNGPALTLKLSSPSILLTNGRGDTFDGNVDPNDNIAFGFGDFYYSYLFYGPVRGTGLLERLSATTELFISGAVSARPASTGVVGRLHGIFLERKGFSERALCNSDHQFELRRK